MNKLYRLAIAATALVGTFAFANTFKVTDMDGKPLANAKILIGMGLNNPFSGNLVTTNATGQVAAPAGWTNAQPVTVHLDGYVRTTHFGRTPGNITFQMKKVNQPPKFELTGTTSGQPIVDNDGFIDFGVVVSALTRNDIMAFDISKVLSFRTDKINFAGQTFEVPSNISVPKQKESYVVPVTIEKASYRLHFGEKDTHRVFAARARFPFRDVIDELSVTSFHELINYFTITGGVVRDVQIKADRTVLNLPVSELTFSGKSRFKAPAMSADEVIIAVAAADLNGYMIPTDVKKLKSNETMNLTTHTASPAIAVGVLKRASEFTKEGADRFSAVMLPMGASGVSPQFLGLIPDPVVRGHRLTFTRPRAVNGVNQIATVSIYSEVKNVAYGTSGSTIPFVTRLWEVYTPSWVDNVELPVWPTGSPQPSKKLWEVAYVGSSLKPSAEMGQAVIDAATHVSHSSVSF